MPNDSGTNTAEPVDSGSRTNAGGIDPTTLMRIKNLELRAKVVVEGLFGGLHRSPYHGFSVEFSEYRQYAQGDDPKYIDWKLYARSDRHYIKQFEDETNLRCMLLLDRSRSMDYGSEGITKSDYATTLAATIAYFLNRQRDAVGTITFADQVLGYLPARYRPGHFHRLLTEFERQTSGTSTNLESALEYLAQQAKRRGMAVLISDLLSPIGELSQRLGTLRAQGHDLIVIRIVDRQELELKLDKPIQMRDQETGKRIYVDPEHARANYQKRFQEHADQLQQTCDQLGVDLVSLCTDEPMDAALFQFLKARNHLASRTVQRASSWSGRTG